MFGPPGFAYVYLVYGMYDCLNLVTEPPGSPAAILIRAVEPLHGIGSMRDARRATEVARRKGLTTEGLAHLDERLRSMPEARLASGPGLVAAAFGIDRTATGLDLLDPASPLRIEPPPAAEPSPEVRATPRVGIAFAGEPWVSLPWRFTIPGHPSVSGPVAGR